MIVKTAKLGQFLGMNNRLPRHALQIPEKGRFVVDALGVDIDETGRLSRADGSTSVTTLTTGRGLFCDGTRMLYADGASLYKIDTLSPFAATAIDTVAAHALAYEAINGEIFYTDGTKLSCLDATNTVRPVGVHVPASLSVASAAGSLSAASYQCTITYFNGVEEGGAYASTGITLAATGGITFTLPTPPTGVTHIGIYVSGPNGEVPLLHSIISPADSVTVTTEPTLRACQTQHKGQMPAGDLLTHLPGYLLVATGNTITYCDPYNFGLTTPAKNYLLFPETVTVMIACEMGVYIVADKAYWLIGLGTEMMELIPVMTGGAIFGSQTAHPSAKQVYWLSEEGLIVADSQGQVKNLQESAMSLSLTGSSGASIYVDGANPRVVTTNG